MMKLYPLSSIRLSKAMLQDAGFSDSEHLDVRVTRGKIVLTKQFHHRTLEDRAAEPLHIPIKTKKTAGFVHCEKMKLFDLNARGHTVKDRVAMADIINITDAIQGIFDYA